VVAAFAHALASGSAPTIWGDGKQTRDFVYVDDVADAFVRAASRGGGLVCNVGTGKETSVNELYRLLAAQAGVAIEPRRGAPRPTDVRRSCLNVERAGIQLGWRSWTPLADGLRAVWMDATTRSRPPRQVSRASG
jgi:UDP-glucose 4-epimerase